MGAIDPRLLLDFTLVVLLSFGTGRGSLIIALLKHGVTGINSTMSFVASIFIYGEMNAVLRSGALVLGLLRPSRLMLRHSLTCTL